MLFLQAEAVSHDRPKGNMIAGGSRGSGHGDHGHFTETYGGEGCHRHRVSLVGVRLMKDVGECIVDVSSRAPGDVDEKRVACVEYLRESWDSEAGLRRNFEVGRGGAGDACRCTWRGRSGESGRWMGS